MGVLVRFACSRATSTLASCFSASLVGPVIDRALSERGALDAAASADRKRFTADTEIVSDGHIWQVQTKISYAQIFSPLLSKNLRTVYRLAKKRQ